MGLKRTILLPSLLNILPVAYLAGSLSKTQVMAITGSQTKVSVEIENHAQMERMIANELSF